MHAREAGARRVGELVILLGVAAGALSDALREDRSLWQAWQGHLAAAVFGLIALAYLRSAEWASIGVRLVPLGGWGRWARAGALAGLVAGGLVLAAWLNGARPAPPASAADWRALLHFVILASILEEVVYRMIVCSVVSPVAGDWPAILASGALFGLSHYLGGNLDPVNLAAGFFFAWCFVRSGSVLVPIALHAGGNLLVLSLGLLVPPA